MARRDNMILPATSPAETEDILYLIPEGVRQANQHNRIQLATPHGGRIWVDPIVLNLWKSADQRRLSEITREHQSGELTEDQIRFGLACLAEAGLLDRSNHPVANNSRDCLQGEQVSVIIVTYNSRTWIQGCLNSIAEQTYSPIEIIIVDNGSQDGTADWVKTNAGHVRLTINSQSCSLAGALNQGIQQASGSYILLLNPDILLEPGAIEELVQTAQLEPNCAAVAAKLLLLWAPAFLNGLGNLVGPSSWGVDIGLGHLDLGQFDGVKTIPSACFAAALIPREKINRIGFLDEKFPMYYEDSEWCYRARLMGFSILAAPHARCLHAFGSRLPSGENEGLSAHKLRRVTCGRLRFITRINGRVAFWRFLFSYFVEDVLRGLVYLITGKVRLSLAVLQGWSDYLDQLPEIKKSRKDIQSQRKIPDRELFGRQKSFPILLMQSGLPALTWDVIRSEYAPLMNLGKVKPLPEFRAGHALGDNHLWAPLPLWKRAAQILKNEGPLQLLYWTGKRIQWWLAQQ